MDTVKMYIRKFLRDPFGFVKRALFKALIGPLKYGRNNDYDAGRYWHDRFSRYGLSIKGPGDESISEDENIRMYNEAGGVFLEMLKKEAVDLANAAVLEIGCGNGFYTQILHDAGVKNYVGLDITDVLFPSLAKRFPEFRFTKKDISSDKLNQTFDLIVMIDVVQHIVNEDKLIFCLNNISGSLLEGGVFIIAPLMKERKKELFYVHRWTYDDIRIRFPRLNISGLIPFRGGSALVIRKPRKQQ